MIEPRIARIANPAMITAQKIITVILAIKTKASSGGNVNKLFIQPPFKNVFPKVSPGVFLEFKKIYERLQSSHWLGISDLLINFH
jgi:hypothetical protein